MKERVYSSSWYRVANLKPRLRNNAQIHRHHYRDKLWYVLRDASSERYFRFTPAAYKAIGFMDGVRTVQEIWEQVVELLGDDAPTQDQLIQLLSQLHAADVLQASVMPDTADFLSRRNKMRKRKWVQQLMSPLFWRFPVYDPERFLNWSIPFVRPLFNWFFFLIWLGVVSYGVFLSGLHWSELTENIMDRVLAPHNLLLIWLTFPVLKLLHEFGHAYAVKVYGGEVHEMGIMLLVLTPLPYVDASASSAFRSKRKRVLVGSAGMMVEIFIASIALYFWTDVEPGVISSILYNLVFLAGVSTILFNINPLLRFDGYYILADILELPNLRSRSYRYLNYLIERYLFGRKDSVHPAETRTVKSWFLLYSIASFFYRILIFVGIILFIAGKFFFIGVMLAFWGLFAWGVLPISKAVKHLLTNPRLRTVRIRAITVSASVVAALFAAVCVVPAPLNTICEGVIWIPDEAIVRSGTDGFVKEVLVKHGEEVSEGDTLFVCEDPLIEARTKIIEAEIEQLEAQYQKSWIHDQVQAELIREHILHKTEELKRNRERLNDLLIRSPTNGSFIVLQPEDLPGRFTRQGATIAQVLELGKLHARVVVPQEAIDLVRDRREAVDVRLAETTHKVVPAVVKRVVPTASEELPSSALGTAGGGDVPTDPLDPKGVRALQKLFQLELELSDAPEYVNVGGRVYIRFNHGWEPLAGRWYRSIRRLFLSRFNV